MREKANAITSKEKSIVKILDNHIHSEVQEELWHFCKGLEIEEVEEVGIIRILEVNIVERGTFDEDDEQKKEWLEFRKAHNESLCRIEDELNNLNRTMEDFELNLPEGDLVDLILDIRDKMKEYDVDYVGEKYVEEELNREKIEGNCLLEVQVEYLDESEDYLIVDVKINLSFILEKTSTGKLTPLCVELLSCEY